LKRENKEKLDKDRPKDTCIVIEEKEFAFRETEERIIEEKREVSVTSEKI